MTREKQEKYLMSKLSKYWPDIAFNIEDAHMDDEEREEYHSIGEESDTDDDTDEDTEENYDYES